FALVTEARRRGATACTLEVRVANHAAQGLYHQFGFAPVGIGKNYYAETGEDALIMWAEGLQTPAYAERLAGLAERIPAPEEPQRGGYSGSRPRATRPGWPWSRTAAGSAPTSSPTSRPCTPATAGGSPGAPPGPLWTRPP